MRVNEYAAAFQVRHSISLEKACATIERLRLALVCGIPAPDVAQMAADALHQMTDAGRLVDIDQGGSS